MPSLPPPTPDPPVTGGGAAESAAGEKRARGVLAALEQGDRVAAYEALASRAVRLRGYLRLRYGPFLNVEEVVHEAVWSSLEALASERVEEDPALFLWRRGVELAKAKLQAAFAREKRRYVAGARRPSGPRDAALERALADAIASLDGPLETIARADLAHGGLAPVADLAAELGVPRATVLDWRREVRRRVGRALEEHLR